MNDSEEKNGFSITAYASLGSNSPDGPEMLARAAESLAGMPGVRVAGISPIYRTQPQDYANQPWFVNQVVKLELSGSWTPVNFLREMLTRETALGRVRGNGPRFGPRKIDMDLLLFGAQTSIDPECVVPHPRMTRRAFVLVPLYSLEPALKINGRGIQDWLKEIVWHLDGDQIYQ